MASTSLEKKLIELGKKKSNINLSSNIIVDILPEFDRGIDIELPKPIIENSELENEIELFLKNTNEKHINVLVDKINSENLTRKITDIGHLLGINILSSNDKKIISDINYGNENQSLHLLSTFNYLKYGGSIKNARKMPKLSKMDRGWKKSKFHSSTSNLIKLGRLDYSYNDSKGSLFANYSEAIDFIFDLEVKNESDLTISYKIVEYFQNQQKKQDTKVVLEYFKNNIPDDLLSPKSLYLVKEIISDGFKGRIVDISEKNEIKTIINIPKKLGIESKNDKRKLVDIIVDSMRIDNEMNIDSLKERTGLVYKLHKNIITMEKIRDILERMDTSENKFKRKYEKYICYLKKLDEEYNLGENEKTKRANLRKDLLNKNSNHGSELLLRSFNWGSEEIEDYMDLKSLLINKGVRRELKLHLLNRGFGFNTLERNSTNRERTTSLMKDLFSKGYVSGTNIDQVKIMKEIVSCSENYKSFLNIYENFFQNLNEFSRHRNSQFTFKNLHEEIILDYKNEKENSVKEMEEVRNEIIGLKIPRKYIPDFLVSTYRRTLFSEKTKDNVLDILKSNKYIEYVKMLERVIENG